MLAVLVFLAETDPLSGGSGWVGAGLLGCVLAWLMFQHLPAKDKQIKEIIGEHNAAIERQAATNQTVINKITSDYERSLDKVVNHCKEEFELLRALWPKLGG